MHKSLSLGASAVLGIGLFAFAAGGPAVADQPADPGSSNVQSDSTGKPDNTGKPAETGKPDKQNDHKPVDPGAGAGANKPQDPGQSAGTPPHGTPPAGTGQGEVKDDKPSTKPEHKNEKVWVCKYVESENSPGGYRLKGGKNPIHVSINSTENGAFNDRQPSYVVVAGEHSTCSPMPPTLPELPTHPQPGDGGGSHVPSGQLGTLALTGAEPWTPVAFAGALLLLGAAAFGLRRRVVVNED